MANLPFLPPQLLNAANKLILILDEQKVQFRIIGGIAVSHHSQARMTEDLDFLIDPNDEAKVKGFFPKYTELYMDSARGFSTTFEGMTVDFILSDHPIQFSEPAGMYHNLPVSGKKGTIYSKLMAGRTKDFTDLIAILKHTPEQERKEILSFIAKEGNEDMASDLSSAMQIADLEEKKDKPAKMAARKIFWNTLLKKASKKD